MYVFFYEQVVYDKGRKTFTWERWTVKWPVILALLFMARQETCISCLETKKMSENGFWGLSSDCL